MVASIASKQFVDMAEVLAENVSPVATLKEANPLSDLVPGTRRKLYPVPDLTSWAACFTAYTIIRCSRHCDDATMLLAYLRLILQETMSQTMNQNIQTKASGPVEMWAKMWAISTKIELPNPNE